MPVNRQIRGELCEALVQWSDGRIDATSLQDICAQIKERLADSTATPEPQDAGCNRVATTLFHDLDPHGPASLVRTRWQYRRMRRYVAFLRSDVDPIQYDSESAFSPARRWILNTYVLVAVLGTLAGLWFWGWRGPLVWPAAALPMWVGFGWSMVSKWGRQPCDSSPFDSVGQWTQHDALCECEPAMPLPETFCKPVTCWVYLSHTIVGVVSVVCGVPWILLMIATASLFWPSLARLNWVNRKQQVPLNASQIPTPCKHCRWASHAKDLAGFREVIPFKSGAVYACRMCGTRWLRMPGSSDKLVLMNAHRTEQLLREQSSREPYSGQG